MSSSALNVINPATYRKSLRKGEFKRKNTMFTCQGKLHCSFYFNNCTNILFVNETN